VTRVKPDPELYLCALGSLGCAPSEAIAFEDSATGIAAAKAAGLYCVAVPNRLSVHSNLDQADLRINSLTELSLEQLIFDREPSLRKEVCLLPQQCG
jgi:beta-phosphoglucomutase-like phosphatase (HAD superfamily)